MFAYSSAYFLVSLVTYSCSGVSDATTMPGIKSISMVSVSLNSISTGASISFSVRPFFYFFANFSASFFLASSSSDVSSKELVS